MFTVTQTIDIDRMPWTVFAVAGDPHKDELWCGWMQKLEGKATGEPAVRVIEYEPEKRVVKSTVCGALAWHESRLFEMVPVGTRLTYSVSCEAQGLSHFLLPLRQAEIEQQLAADLRHLKNYLEQRP